MNAHFPVTRLSTTFLTLALGAAIGMNAQPAPADDARPPMADKVKRQLDRQAVQREIVSQTEGIHKISDGSICVKCGRGMAIIHADGHGCGTGCNAVDAPPVAADIDLMAGVFVGLFMDPQEGANLGITPDQAAKIKDAYNYIDHAGVNPAPVLKVYQDYVKAPQGKAKADAEKALMEKVRAIGQAYVDAEAKKLKDVKALLTPRQLDGIRIIGGRMLHPFEKPVA